MPEDAEPLPAGVMVLTGGVYALSRDTDLSSPLKITGEVTLDLNGHVLSGDGLDSVILVDGGALTRAQAVTMLYRYMRYTGADVRVGEDTNILSYADAFDIPEWAVPAVQWACGAGVMQGSGGYLTPNGGCTRAQIVTLLWRAAGIG